MNIDEAIKQLTDIFYDPMFPKNQEDIYGLKLGIEALKWTKKERPGLYGDFPPLLPGETE